MDLVLVEKESEPLDLMTGSTCFGNSNFKPALQVAAQCYGLDFLWTIHPTELLQFRHILSVFGESGRL